MDCNYFHYMPGSEWITVVDTGRRTADGRTVPDLLVDTLHKFPSYDLQSARGFKAAVRDMEANLCSATLFEGVDDM